MTPGPWIMQEPLPGVEGVPVAILGPDGKRLVAQVFTGPADAKIVRCSVELAMALRGSLGWVKDAYIRADIASLLKRAGVEPEVQWWAK